MNKFYGLCPFCKKEIPLVEKKDFESFTMIEVFDHMKRDHQQVLNAWYKEHPFGVPYITQMSA